MDGPNYNFFDRMAHRLAFKTGFAQQMLCDLEMQFYRKEIKSQTVVSPIFVTALPRAGTTLLLEILARHPDVVTQTYRDMPFVLSPIVWRKLSGKFQTDLAKRERSHSDGMMVDADSPEAFEEVLWLKEYPEKFGKAGIELWSDGDSNIAGPMSDLIRRIIAARPVQSSGQLRYLSKNNANIARIPSLRGAFPDARFVVPLRAPLDHAMSMHRQYLRYLDIHLTSSFTRDYMSDIGHFEFGALHRPILFQGMTSVIDNHNPRNLDYWIGYWICAYRHLAELGDVSFVDMGRFTERPNLGSILIKLGLRNDQGTANAAEQLLHPIKRYERPERVDPSLLKTAELLCEEILSNSDWVLPS